MPRNKGFKGIDKRDFVAPDYSSRKSGRQSTSGHGVRRNSNHDAARSEGYTTYQLKAEDWQRVGVSASYSAESGSKLFHSDDTNWGANWNTRQAWSNVTVKAKGWKNREEYAQISFRIGNCLNGNSNGSWYGMGGVGPWAAQNKSQMNSTTNPDTYSIVSSTWPFTYMGPFGFWSSANNQLKIQVYSAVLGTINPCNEGDLIELRFHNTGIYEVYHNGSLFATSKWNARLDALQPTNEEWIFNVGSNQEGAAGNYMIYDVQFTGELSNYTDGGGICHEKWKTQLNQTMLPISASGFKSGSYSGAAMPVMSTNAISGSCVSFNNGSYTTPIWTTQFLTGSGIGGIYTYQYPSGSPAETVMNEIIGITDHSLVTGYNYWTNTISTRTGTKAWTDGGASQCQITWYEYNSAGTAGNNTGTRYGSNNYPVTSGSIYAYIVTGSHSENARLFGGSMWDFGSTTADGAQTVALLGKLIDTTGGPINDYVSGNWITLQQSIYEASGKGTAPKKLFFNDGDTGVHFCNIEIGEQWVASGSF